MPPPPSTVKSMHFSSFSVALQASSRMHLCASSSSSCHGSTQCREQQYENIGERFKQENHDDETPTGKLCQPSTIGQEETHQGLVLSSDRLGKEEAAHQKPNRSRITSCLFFRLSRNLGLDEPNLTIKTFDPCLHSSTETQQVETENSSFQVNGQTFPPHIFIKKASESTLSERIPFPSEKKEESLPVVCYESETGKGLSKTHSISNGELDSYHCDGLHMFPCGPQPTSDTRSVELGGDIKDHTRLEKPTDLVVLSNLNRTMLSSTVVTVLAPHWNGRPRRTKRPEVTGNWEAQGGLHDVTNTAANRSQGRFHESLDRSSADGSQAQSRGSFLGTRRNTVGWSTKSGPESLDYESKRKFNHTVSLDVNSGRMNSRQMYAGAVSPVHTAATPVSPLSFETYEQRTNSGSSRRIVPKLETDNQQNASLFKKMQFK
uniref:uncharacterized protein LOC120811670 isoform X1 n=1 Tax=Gasterosteus aculeatus aculeatus TaxID=481459 RepID=UPI001A99720C|nr:uncharacterized protein LOC120811670 isoform X1 [Gasterosteus aculeatus aculeatus]